MWWAVAAAWAFPSGHTEVTVERLSEEMHWFDATAMHVETIACTVGVPVSGEAEPFVGCWFPGGRIADPEVPDGLGWAARAARKAVYASERSDDLGSPVRDVRVTYRATERRAWLCDQALLPNGLLHSGRVVVGIRGEEAHIALGGMTGRQGGGESLLGCEGRPVALDVPEGLDGRSVITLEGASEWASVSAFESMLRGLPSIIAAMPPTPTVPTRGDSAPFGVVEGIDGRLQPGGSEGWVYVPEGKIIGTRVTWRFTLPDGAEVDGGTVLVGGLPDDWAPLASAPVPEGALVRATLEVFATDVPIGPEWTPEAAGFERLRTAAIAFVR